MNKIELLTVEYFDKIPWLKHMAEKINEIIRVINYLVDEVGKCKKYD